MVSDIANPVDVAREQAQQARQILNQRQQDIAKTKEQLSKVEQSIPATSQRQLRGQTSQGGLAGRQFQQKLESARGQVGLAKEQVAQYEEKELKPFEAQVKDVEAQIADYDARVEGMKLAEKFYADKIPYQYVEGYARQYLKEMYQQAALISEGQQKLIDNPELLKAKLDVLTSKGLTESQALSKLGLKMNNVVPEIKATLPSSRDFVSSGTNLLTGSPTGGIEGLKNYRNLVTGFASGIPLSSAQPTTASSVVTTSKSFSPEVLSKLGFKSSNIDLSSMGMSTKNGLTIPTSVRTGILSGENSKLQSGNILSNISNNFSKGLSEAQNENIKIINVAPSYLQRLGQAFTRAYNQEAGGNIVTAATITAGGALQTSYDKSVQQGTGNPYQYEGTMNLLGLAPSAALYSSPVGLPALAVGGASQLISYAVKPSILQSQIGGIQETGKSFNINVPSSIATGLAIAKPVAEIGLGTSPYWFPIAKGYVSTYGRKEIPTENVIPKDVLSGKNRFPELPREQQYQAFKSSPYKLPEQNVPGGFHATGDISFTKSGEVIVSAGSSELPGLYMGYGVSPNFLRVSGSAEVPKDFITRWFGDVINPVQANKPGVLQITPSRFEINPAQRVNPYQINDKGDYFKYAFKNPTKEGIAYIPLMKTEVESILIPGTKLTKVGERYFFKYNKVRVPIDEYKTISVENLPKKNIITSGDIIETTSYSLPEKSSSNIKSISSSVMGISPPKSSILSSSDNLSSSRISSPIKSDIKSQSISFDLQSPKSSLSSITSSPNKISIETSSAQSSTKSREASKSSMPSKISTERITLSNRKQSAKEVLKAIAKKEGFEVFQKKGKKLVSIGVEETKYLAGKKLKSALLSDISASGEVIEKRTGQKIRATELGLGTQFRQSKVSPFRLVQKEGTRLSSRGEILGIQAGKRRKKSIWS